MKIIKNKEYTHLAKIYGIECYYDINSCTYKGITILHHIMINLFISIDFNLFNFSKFKLEIIKEI